MDGLVPERPEYMPGSLMISCRGIGRSAMRQRESGTRIEIEPYRGDLLKYLAGLDGLVAAWIYGSYGTPYQTPLSDLDLALLFRRDRAPDLSAQGQLYLDLARILHEDDFSILVLNRAPVIFQFRVLESGRIIVCRDPVALADFTELVFSRHADYIVDHERFVEEYDQALRERYVDDR
jgi:predicted nucleotidyltransferase